MLPECDGWNATPDLNETYSEVRRLGLEANIAELCSYGFTTIPNALSPDLVGRLVAAIAESVEERTGLAPDLETGRGHPNLQFQPFLLYRDRAFEEALMNERVLTLAEYLVGRRCVLSSMGSHFKGPGDEPLPLHTDNGNGIPQPFPSWGMVATCNYALTDYTRDGGSFAVVPGSHLWARHPIGNETNLSENGNPLAVPIEVPAGTAIVWHANTWHGSYARRIPGVRINLAPYFCRQFVVPQENYRGTVTKEILDRNNERFARLMGHELAPPNGDEGLDWEKMMRQNIPTLSIHQ
jgi:ectoine hydroxylase-related dioxygenase (phytanoyl-CoA dioxygenase family)